MTSTHQQQWIKQFFRYGHIAKGIIYTLIGLFAFATIIGVSGGPSGTKETIKFVQDQPFGQILMAILGIGLLSYGLWRWAISVMDTQDTEDSAKGWIKRAGYAFSGAAYLGLAYYTFQLFMGSGGSSGGKESMVARLLAQPWGQILVGIVAAVILGVAIYQGYKGISEKFMEKVNISSDKRQMYRYFGIFGHVARAIIFAIISFFLFQAALQSDASEFKGTEGALEFLESSSYGIWLVSIMGLGMICYGLYMFVKAKYGEHKA